MRAFVVVLVKMGLFFFILIFFEKSFVFSVMHLFSMRFNKLGQFQCLMCTTFKNDKCDYK